MREEMLEKRKKIILDIINDKNYIPMKAKELAILLQVSKEERADLDYVLQQLVASGQVMVSKRGKYKKPENNHFTGVFHGTTKKFEQIDLKKSHNRRDFGMGFYTTILENQAKEWAYRLSLRQKVRGYYVYQYMFAENEQLNIRRFDSLNKEWLEFIKQNRLEGGLQHDYDIVIGPVADDNTMEAIQLYIAGILSADETVERLRYNRVNNQISFHTEKALECLEFIRRLAYE